MRSPAQRADQEIEVSFRGLVATAVVKSGNQKIGKAAATYTAQVSCPSDCVFFNGGGCYAESGATGTFVTAPLNEEAARRGATLIDVADAEAASIDRMPTDKIQGLPMRLHGVGDCRTDEAARIVSATARRYRERGGGPVWTYTHAWRTVQRRSWEGVSVLASCETVADAHAATARGYAPSIVVDVFADHRLYKVSGGTISRPERDLQVLPCPAQTHHDVSCASCRLCMDDEALLGRGYAIGFAVHGDGNAMKKAMLALHDPDSPTRRLTSRDFITDYRNTEGEWPTTRQVQDGADVTKASAYEMLKRMKGAQCQ